MKAIGYIRVSTEDQAREGISLENQDAKVKSYASLNDLDLIDIIRDEGVSGKSLDRAGMTRLLDMVDNGKVEAIVVYKLDRLSRKTIDTLNLIETFETKGIAFHSISEKVDTKSATGKFFLTIISAISQMERDVISERTIDALNYKKTKKEWLGRIPYGFKIEDNHLVEDPEQIKSIQKAKRMKRAGKSIRDIADGLDMSKSVVHRLVNVNLKSVKAKYVNGLAV
jgi:site-specific DNA recombinase